MAAPGLKMLHPESFGTRPMPYSPGVLVEAPTAVLYLAGQVPVDSEGAIVGEGDFILQRARSSRTSVQSWPRRRWTSRTSSSSPTICQPRSHGGVPGRSHRALE